MSSDESRLPAELPFPRNLSFYGSGDLINRICNTLCPAKMDAEDVVDDLFDYGRTGVGCLNNSMS